jgi:3-methyladenine DNA glycosylase Tag
LAGIGGENGEGAVRVERIRERAAKRKGGEKVLLSLMPKKPNHKALARLGDDRVLSAMAERVFSAGFVWSVIDNKWPGFEAAFLDFNPKRLLFQPAEFWDKLATDKRIVRNPQKIKSVRENAKFVTEVAAEHGSFGRFLAAWPADDQVGLMEVLAKRGSRLGGHSGQYFLRFIGWDAFVLSGHVVLCLRDCGVPLSESGSSKKDLRAAQAQLNAWKQESGLPMSWVSRISAMSIGENYEVARLKEIMQT